VIDRTRGNPSSRCSDCWSPVSSARRLVARSRFRIRRHISLTIAARSGACDRRRCISTCVICASSRRIFGGSAVAPSARSPPTLLTAFLLEPGLQGKPLGPDGMQGRGGTLRLFLRYLHREGILSTDLSRAVPRRRAYRQSSLPRAITWSEVERVLAVPDRRAPIGKRDYAMLLLLATYGLRARDVAALQLGLWLRALRDVDWPHGVPQETHSPIPSRASCAASRLGTLCPPPPRPAFDGF